ncbi:MAG: hypothetical protein K1X74_13265 [Pirellulales bacterium]|nr:hypothetical protein [Pirellulales bacterium]
MYRRTRFFTPWQPTALLKAVVLLLSCAGLPLVARADDEPIRWRFSAGEQFMLQVDQQFEAATIVGDNSSKSNGTMSMQLQFNVKELLDNGAARCEMGITRMQLKLVAPIATLEFDTANKEEPENPQAQLMAKVLRPFTELKYTLTIDPRGNILDVELPKDAAKNLASQLGSIPGGGQFNDLLNEETFAQGFKQMSGNGWLIWPETMPAVGDTWKQEGTIANPILGRQTEISTFRYEGPVEIDGHQLEKVAVEITMDYDPDDQAKLPIKVKISEQEQKGYIYFDRQAGRIDHSELTQHIDMDLETMGQAFEQEINVETKSRFEPADATGETQSESESKPAGDAPAAPGTESSGDKEAAPEKN